MEQCIWPWAVSRQDAGETASRRLALRRSACVHAGRSASVPLAAGARVWLLLLVVLAPRLKIASDYRGRSGIFHGAFGRPHPIAVR